MCLSVFAHDDDDASIVFCRIIFNSNAMLPSWINSSVYRFQNWKWHSFFSFFLFVFTRCLFLDSYIQMSLFWLVLVDSCVSGLLLFSFFMYVIFDVKEKYSYSQIAIYFVCSGWLVKLDMYHKSQQTQRKLIIIDYWRSDYCVFKINKFSLSIKLMFYKYIYW